MRDNNFIIRLAVEKDVPTIYSLILELAVYENMEDQMSTSESILHHSLFVVKTAEVLICEYEGQPVGYALFCKNFSTFLGKAQMYLEDIYVSKSYRGKGMGKALMSSVAKLAVERGCNRLDWVCLDWNKSSIDFYKANGAVALDEWTVFRLENKALVDMAASQKVQ